ncbi:DNA gyrase subunit A [Rhodovibrio sodomensis]|uniref:DNA gyrase subunit A n=1 Tax=Rhodovibrio sodomensis TaxID=1088 RepID=A0ABS1DBN0_9PROT|nr:DNA gyrase subunit A [Rhodovibrio sodomensis]MBK1667326.1 DNA gyrase subunit A [Rhodovibrio sodomensis]
MPDGALVAPTTEITHELGDSYLAYAMSVIVSRALPDVRDGLKPVHRRILYAMKRGGYTHDKPHRKSARIVGDVMGMYHPHGDSAIYDAMVRLAQDFSMSVPLVDGQGNFGSIDGDPPAAMRYTESRLSRYAPLLLDEIDRDTVTWTPNYDGSEMEPEVLPAGFPHILVNGAGGIAVGMATRIPPHNPGEVLAATLALIDNPSASLAQLLEYCPGPDFPTGGTILGHEGIRQAYETGRGSIIVRARHTFEKVAKGRAAIAFTELPYQVNKARLVVQINELAKERQIEGIHEVRDESDRHGIRLVVELKREANEDVVLAQLHKRTELQVSFPANMLALDHNQPRQMNLREILQAWIDFRRQVIRRRTLHDLREARKRAHVVTGLLVAIANIDRVIALIRQAPDSASARAALMAEPLEIGEMSAMLSRVDPKAQVDGTVCQLTEEQAKAILELRLHRLTGLERDKLEAESKELCDQISHFLDVLNDQSALTRVMREELEATARRMTAPRRTDIEQNYAEYDEEDLIPREEMIVTLTHGGYVKRVPLSDYRCQARNGKGRAGMNTKDDDFVTRVVQTSTHTPLMIFTDRGIAYKLKVYQLPLGTPQGRGRPIVNLLPNLGKGERIAALLALPEDPEAFADTQVAFFTAGGYVRRNTLADFANVPSNGKIAMKLEDAAGKATDSLVNVLLCADDQHFAVSTRMGQVLRFPASQVRVFAGRSSLGVRGIRLRGDDKVVSAMVLEDAGTEAAEAPAFLTRAAKVRRQETGEADDDGAVVLDDDRFAELQTKEQLVLTVTSNGYGRRTSAYAYRVANRGGIGTIDLPKGKKVGDIVSSFVVEPGQEMVLITDKGQLIRTDVDSVRITGRAAVGVRLIKLSKGEQIVSIAPVASSDTEHDEATD